MERPLRCNNVKCRRELVDHAVAATCSHALCLDCANLFQLSGQHQGQRRVCPICSADLPNPDDVVFTNLNPTEDYKASVLSGLSPSIIMECAGRALGFWAYQITQEIHYQEHSVKNLTERFSTLGSQMDRVVNDANAEILNLRNRLSNFQADNDGLKQANEQLSQAYREQKNKNLATQEKYDKLRRRGMLDQVQNAAMDAVDQTIQASVTANRFVDKVGNQNTRLPPVPLFDQSNVGRQHRASNSGGGQSEDGAQFDRSGNRESNWAEFSSQTSAIQNQPIQTPSTNRQRFGSMNPGATGIRNIPQGQPNGISSTPILHRRPLTRPPLANANGNNRSPSGFAGYGLSAGLKVSNSAASAIPRSATNSRVAQRPVPTFQAGHASKFSLPNSNQFADGNNYY